MELTPKFKKPKKQRTRTARIPSHVLPGHLEQLETLSNYANLSKTQILEIVINEAYNDFKFNCNTKNPKHNYIFETKIQPLNPKKMETKPQTHLFNPDGSQVNEKLIFTNFSTYQKSFFNTLEEAEQQIKAGAVTGYIYDEKTRRQRFYTNGILSNEKQL